MRYARDAWNAERASWRSVIQLNLIRSILTIVDTLQAEMDSEFPQSDSPNVHHSRHSLPPDNSSTPVASSPTNGLPPLLNGKHQLLQLRLGPLRRIEGDLKRRLGAQAEEEEDGDAAYLGPLGPGLKSQASYSSKKEFGVCRLTEALAQGLVSPKTVRGSDHGSVMVPGDNVVDEVTEVIAGCKDDMIALWSDRAVKTVLKNWNVRLEDSAGL